MRNNLSPSRNTLFSLELVGSSQSQRIASSTLHADSRNSSRFDTCTAAELTTAEGNKFSCIIANISSTGLQFESDYGIQSILRTGFMCFRRHKASIVDFSFSLPDRISPFNPVCVTCKTVYTRNTKEGAILTGVKFVSFKEGEDILIEYLSFREIVG